jgi:hypothetical protein
VSDHPVVGILEGPGGRSFALVWTPSGLAIVERETGQEPDEATTAEITRVLAGVSESWGGLARVEVLGEAAPRPVAGAFRGEEGSFALLAGEPPLLVRVEERGPIPLGEEASKRVREGLEAGRLRSDPTVQKDLLRSTAARRGPIEWLATDPVRVVVQEAFLDARRLVRASTGPRSDPGVWLERRGTRFVPVALEDPLDLVGGVVKIEAESGVTPYSIEAIAPVGGVLIFIGISQSGGSKGWMAFARVDGRLQVIEEKALKRQAATALEGAVFLDSDLGPL